MPYQFINQLNALAKREYTGKRPSLAQIKKALRVLHHPEKAYPAIHITGTNGKGSTAIMIQSILVQAGFRVGLYTSPHLLDVKERIRINNKNVSKQDLERLLKVVFTLPAHIPLTYFEILTTAALLYFAEQKVDFLVAEVGLGGTYDATCVLKNKIVSIITAIDLDHTEVLGKKLSQIAKTKAGIIKNKTPVIVNTGHKKIDAIINAICCQKKAPLYLLDKDFSAKLQAMDWQKLQQTFSYFGMEHNYPNLSLKMLGEHQMRNASLALATIEIMQRKYAISKKAIYQGLKNAFWPGRFEITNCKIGTVNRQIIFDGAHNSASSRALEKTFLASPYKKEKVVLVMSVLKNKNHQAICRHFSAIFHKVIIFKLDSLRALEPDLLVREWQKYLPQKNILVIKNLAELKKALKKDDRLLCVSGSLYAVAAVKKIMKKYKKIPKFKSEKEEKEFWEKHDSTDYLNWKRAQMGSFPNLKTSR